MPISRLGCRPAPHCLLNKPEFYKIGLYDVLDCRSFLADSRSYRVKPDGAPFELIDNDALYVKVELV